ncbi:MAG: hypothetical protein PWP06_1122 [Candidatus Marinimicrobia bacterium]|jgi:methylmalonyl-CoA mutase N-terminal domain/subunit|nr:hypothetical protein [Candidatus Neomarinimicrobiota bacterium]
MKFTNVAKNAHRKLWSKTIKKNFIPKSNQKIENKEHLFTGALFFGTKNQPGGF